MFVISQRKRRVFVLLKNDLRKLLELEIILNVMGDPNMTN